MTTTAAGDAAVARLNKATEAFEKIITGASNQVVDVPGYGNQPTLAARVDERLDETTATAAAEADRSRDEADRATTQANAAANSVTQATAEYNKARTQADRAQSEADRAAQITGLDTVSDAVAMAALPLPDVWAPLTDSLRLFTGYGREVKVGEDVVARMVNFSRSTAATYIDKSGLLKTAAANEPRFEKEGLLIEGQSTNLFLYSKSPDSYPWYANYVNGDASYIKITDGVRITGAGYYSYQVLPVIAGQKYTFSVTCKVLSGTLDKVGLEGDAFITLGSGLTPEDGTVRLSGTVTPSVNSYATCVYYPTQNSVVEFTDIQFEALPYATSPIYADGAAATRAADIASLPQSLNLGESQLGFSLAVDFDSVNPGPYRVISLSDYSAVLGDGANIYIRHAGREIGPFPAQLGKRNRLAYTVDLSGAITACINGVQITAQSRIAAGPRSNEKIMFGNHINTALNLALEGHLRDLKIWTKTPLTVEQLKVASA
ncbi:phage head spike fiber domain-containing protein [Aeromonas jandaei]